MVMAIMPWLTIAFVFVSIYFYSINKYYLISCQGYKRVTSNLRSPYLSIISEAASGY